MRGIDNIYLVADLIVALDKLPQRQAGFEVNILHNGVGTHYRRSDIDVSHLLTECRAFIALDGFFDMLDSLPDGKTRFVDSFKAVSCFKLEADAHLLAHFIVKVGIVGHCENFLVLGDLLELFVSSYDKDIQSVHEGIDELIFVGHHTLFLMDIEYL